MKSKCTQPRTAKIKEIKPGAPHVTIGFERWMLDE